MGCSGHVGLFALGLLCLGVVSMADERFHLSPEVFGKRNLFGIVREIAVEQPEVVKMALTDFRKSVLEQEVDDRLKAAVESESFNLMADSDCSLCTTFANIIKLGDYDTLEAAVIDLCVQLANSLQLRGDILCPGTIKLQGPHIARVLKERGVTSEMFCEYFNACFPAEVKNADSLGGTAGNTQRRTRKNPKTRSKRRTKNNTKTQTNEKQERQGVIRVVQLTDIHVERNYSVGSSTECGLPVCCLSKWGPGDAGPLGDYNCNIPRSTIELFLEHVKTFQPDIVFFSGDVPPHTVWDETPESQMACTEMLVDTISKNLSIYNVYPIVGNHEMYPTNLFSVDYLNYTLLFIDRWKTLWQPLANFSVSEVQDTGSYSLQLRPGLKLIVFNTNYMYTLNWYNVMNDPKETEGMRQFLQQSLSEAKANNEKVILVGHHPPGGADYIVSGSRWFEQLVLNYSDIIVLMPSGHTHTDEFRLIYDSSNQPKGVVYVAPSMSAGGSRNPSMRVYEMDSTTYEVVDYQHHFLDLRPAIAYSMGKALDWKMNISLLYSAKSEYGLQDLSPKSWENLLERFVTDEELLTKHRLHSNADASSTIGPCTDACLQGHICRMMNAHYDKYLDCLDLPPPTTQNPAGPTPVGPANDQPPASILSRSAVTGALLFHAAIHLRLWLL